MPKLEGKVAAVTGGSSGIGLSTAKRFVKEGAFVYVTGRRRIELDQAVSEIGRSVTAVRGDVSNLADLDRLYARVGEEKGKFDILFAGAGIVDPSRSPRSRKGASTTSLRSTRGASSSR
jgi:NAD(P)-dependent dehydrogenase (short-subunit alcohol dehydrogenase family)